MEEIRVEVEGEKVDSRVESAAAAAANVNAAAKATVTMSELTSTKCIMYSSKKACACVVMCTVHTVDTE